MIHNLAGLTLKIHVEPQIEQPFKLNEKKSYFDYVIRICKKHGATNVSIIDSFYWNYKYPDRPKAFEFVIRLNSNIKTVRAICNYLMTEFLSIYNNLPRIWVEEKKGLILNFVKDGKKGRLRVFTIEQNSPYVSLNTRVIQIINPEEYQEENER